MRLRQTTYEDRRRWSQIREAVRRRWGTLLAGTLMLVLGGLALLVLPVDPVMKGISAGMLFATAVWFPLTAITIWTYAATVGSWAESSTEALLKRERPSWPMVSDVPMEHHNVVHVAVSPRAVLAIETKFLGASSSWARDYPRNRFVEQAQKSAHSVRLLLRSTEIGEKKLPVRAVLVLWGPGAPEDAPWKLEDEVHVVSGRQAVPFLGEWDAGEITAEQGSTVKDGLERYQRKRREYDLRTRGRA